MNVWVVFAVWNEDKEDVVGVYGFNPRSDEVKAIRDGYMHPRPDIRVEEYTLIIRGWA